ncbi:transcriptional regulator, LacI family [Bifidobacterium bohemicum]|uniref:LacI family transcription regulator n=1 Tax=Bifidobacterium bohemicum DSM 22767 TaxID=1437606 RepID=A0A086ZKE2_9BIFI|nr:LacI family DNA-binding transcriptional regulator [Bifidobacterium bohemicum]KFI46992.1 LacI family transcription regulator [Bifidobacterium bohemicum DSM 22767]SCB87162.1 transcriptional regulator, LacI family [Bifidobacterium bohemicum]
MSEGKVRIEDVAREAGVSTATVSRTIHGLPGVGAETREQVLEITRELGYIPSHSAMSLASGSTHSIGLVLPDVSRWFFANAVEAAEQILRTNGYDALIYSLPDYREGGRRRFDPRVLDSKVDAVAVISLFFDNREVRLLRSLGVPAAFLSVDQPGFTHVGIDDEDAMSKACEHLIGLGHRVIGHLSGMTNDKCPNAPTQRRRNGWRKTLLAHGLECGLDLDSPADIMTAKNGFVAANALLDRRPDVTAIVASSDEMAMGAIQALRDRSIEPGRQVSVVGIDGHDLDEAFGLTSVEQPVRREAARIIQLLLQQLAGDERVRRELFDTNLVRRASSARLEDR